MIILTNAQTFIRDISELADEVGSTDWQAGGAFGDIVDDMARSQHISADLYRGARRLLSDMRRAHGTSAGVGLYGEDRRGGDGRPCSGDLEAFDRMSRVLGRLRAHERALLSWCILSRELRSGELADWGREHSRFKTRQQAKAYALGQIRSLVESITEAYSLRPGAS